MSFFKKMLRFLLFVIASAAIGWYIGFLSQVKEISPLKKTVNSNVNSEEPSGMASQPVRKFPELQDPKDLEYKWVYNGKEYIIKMTLYQSVYDFYRSSPKDYVYYGELPENWENDYYGMFIKHNPIDPTVPDLAAAIQDLGKKNRLSEDQIAELVTAFVQNIPYDDAKSQLIEGGSEDIKPVYPYEILYDQKGVCSEKSFLLTALLRDLGYGTVLFEYKEAKHIAVGVKCPPEYSSYDSGYCYTETTQPGHRIGVIPDFGKESNVAILKKEIQNFEEGGETLPESKKLGVAKMFQQEDGRIYTGILYTIKTQSKIDGLEGEIATLKQELNPLKDKVERDGAEIEKLKKDMNDLKKDKKYEAYNDAVPAYNKAVEDYRVETATYNSKVNLYNQKVSQYNRLIKEFND